MNLPIFARYIGGTVIGDIDGAEIIVARLNDLVSDPRDKFLLSETGYQMLIRFKMLPLADRRRIEQLSLIDEGMWPDIIRQMDYLAEPIQRNISPQLTFKHTLHIMFGVVSLLIVLATMMGYYVLLQVNDDRFVSHVFGLLGYLLDIWKSLSI